MRLVLGLIIFLVVLVAPAAAWIPNDRGQSGVPGGWQQDQWNFMPGTGVDAPRAWDNLIAAGRPGGRGVTIAVVDSGVAFRRSPDLNANRFTRGYDFCARKGSFWHAKFLLQDDSDALEVLAVGCIALHGCSNL